MCGRAACSLAPDVILRLMASYTQHWIDQAKYNPSYNVAPGKFQAILIYENNEYHLISAKWGLISSVSPCGSKKPINARCETITSLSMFKRLIANKRCVIISEGFFEWLKKDKLNQPYFI